MSVMRFTPNTSPTIGVEIELQLIDSKELSLCSCIDQLLAVLPPAIEPEVAKAPDGTRVLPCPCPRCGGRMIVIEVFARGWEPRWQPLPVPAPIRIDTS